MPKVLLLYPNLPLMMAPSISIAIFNSILKQEGCEVRLFETTHYTDDYTSKHIRQAEIGATRSSHEKDIFSIQPTDKIIPDFIKLIDEFCPDLILVSVQEDVWQITIKLLESVRHLEIPHILGGLFPTNAPNIVINHPLVQRIGMHEGEDIVRSAARALINFQPLNDIPGIWWKDENNIIHKNALPSLVDISSVTPDFTCFEPSRFQRPMGGKLFKRAIPMETYRGCPYNCTFCNSPSTRHFATVAGTGKFLRRKCADTIERDLLYYIDLYDPDLIMFIDDTFAARPKKEILQFCEMWSHYKIPFYMNTRIETCDLEILRALKEVGLFRMSIGIEAGNEEYRSNMLKRHVSNKTYLKYFEILNQSNVPYTLNAIIGMPFETRELILETADLIHQSKGYDGITMAMFQPYHGTELRKIAVDAGFLSTDYCNNIDERGGYLDNWNLKMPKPYVQPADVQGLVKCFPLYCYYPKEYWSDILIAETDDTVYKKLFDIYKAEFLTTYQLGGMDRINSCVKHDVSSSYTFEEVTI